MGIGYTLMFYAPGLHDGQKQHDKRRCSNKSPEIHFTETLAKQEILYRKTLMTEIR